MTILDTSERRRWRLEAFIAVVTAVALGLMLLLLATKGSFWHDTDWIVLALFGALLFLAETRPGFTMKFGDNGSVSPGWTFAYALVLFGMPVQALVILLLANLMVDVQTRRPPMIVVFNLAQIGGSLSFGALVLDVFGVRSSITSIDRIPVDWGIAIFGAACAILLMNGLLTAMAIGLHTGAGFMSAYRSGLALSMTADGALMSLAPIFVIAVDYSLLLVPLLASTSYIVIRSARSSLQRAHDASHDPLTGLLNRRAFDERLGKTVGMFGGEQHAVLMVMDFDRFKEINDALGHAAGDLLLARFADRLIEQLPPTASAARLGGDEFAVIIPGEHATATIDMGSFELHDALVQPFDLDGFPLSVSVSIGVAIAPDDGTNPEDLIAAADLAMYRAKRSQSGVEFHGSGGSSTEGTGRIDLLADLAAAIADDHLAAHYQPQVELATGEIDTVEALIRWGHDRYGLIPPGDFIGLAEQTDLIDDLTLFMLRRSMSDMLTLDRPDISLAVNVSARSLHQRRFATLVFECLAETGFPAHRLELEITERAIAADPERMSLTITQLRERGIRVAIDDFGTGYSSFGSLRQIPTDRLKIDRQFTERIVETREDRLVVETITRLAHGLGLEVVVEGVGSAEILHALRDLDVDYAQGYAIAHPMAAAELRSYIATTHPVRTVPA